MTVLEKIHVGKNVEYIIDTHNLKTNALFLLLHSFGSAEFFIFPIKFNRLLDGVFEFGRKFIEFGYFKGVKK